MKRPRSKDAPSARPRRAAGAAGRTSNDVLPFEHDRLMHELEVHQLELEVQNRALRDSQAVLEESRARYAELYDHAPVGYLTLDDAGVVRELNLAAAALLAAERRAVVDRPFLRYVAPESQAAFLKHLRASLKARHPLSVELDLLRPDGDARAVELLTVPPPPDTTSPTGRLSTLHAALMDTSQLRKGDGRRDEARTGDCDARAWAKRVHDIKQDFLAVVSHELRAPLAPMLMWVRTLRAGALSETLRKRAVDALDTCLRLQVALIDDLIDVAQGRQGTLRVDLQKVDLARAVRAAVEALSPAAAAKQIDLAIDVPAAPLWVDGDAIRLQQVVANLLSNAVAFTREAGRIELVLHARGASAVLTVRDDGEGIAAARLPHLFEPFHGRDRLVPPHHHGGLGLGLAIVRELIERHGGSVSVESAGQRRGACFTVTLPRLEPAPPAG